MCGIVGQIAFKGAALALPCLDMIEHRGPDESGEWYSHTGQVYLGHTRLAILEPSPAGRQPMHSACGRYCISFNGEIYNHLELREQLPHVAWRGTSDTETLLELFAAKGMEAIVQLRGMFAFAIYDTEQDTLLLTRDELGIKPLWWKKEEEHVSFASEVRPLLSPGEVRPCSKALEEYIAFGRMPATGHVFRQVKALPPGSWLQVNSEGTITQGHWSTSLCKRPATKLNHTDAVQRVRQLVRTAVEEHLISDVGVGAFLSGGIDSSIVCLEAAKQLGRQLQTFTVGFREGAGDERKMARALAAKIGAEHHELEIGESDCISWVQEAVQYMDLPSVDGINTYIVAKAVRKAGIKVALSGLGGDELFGGYPSFARVPLLSWLRTLPISFRNALLQSSGGLLEQKFSAIPRMDASSLTVNYRRFTSVGALQKMGLGDGTPQIPTPPGNMDEMGLISWAELQSYTIPMLLRDSDQMSMALGLEIRVPLLAKQLVQEVLAMPQHLKKGRGTKPLLVQAYKNELPPEVYSKPKQGFVLPMDVWMQGPIYAFVEEGVQGAAYMLGLGEPLLQRDLFYAGRTHWTRVWLWCVLGHWLLKQSAGSLPGLRPAGEPQRSALPEISLLNQPTP